MIGAIGGTFSYYNTYNPYMAALRGNSQTNAAAQALQGNQRATVLAGRRAANLETPVEPVRPVTPVSDQETAPRLGPIIREGADPAEMAVRMRIRPYEDPDQNAPALRKTEEDNQPGSELKVGAGSAQEAVEEGKCQTCEKRKYQDESDDMGVSFQTPTRIAPEQVAAAVRGHENEHVVREQAKARQEDRKVVSQSVTLHTEICPECGKPYISGGTTRTVTKADNTDEQAARQEQETQRQNGKTPSTLFG